MKTPTNNAPLQVLEAPAAVDAELAPLLSEPLASAWGAGTELAADRQSRLRERLAARASNSRRAAQALHTVRRRRWPQQKLSHGVVQQLLFGSAHAERPTERPASALRLGEPVRVRLFELNPGASLNPALIDDRPNLQREWLVLQGQVQAEAADEGPAETLVLSLRDYHVLPPLSTMPTWKALQPSLLFLRESLQPPAAGERASTVRDTEAGWPDYAPGIRRRVLWQRDGQAAMLYFAQPGASVPLHRHGHDEECLMVQGELFLDDELLQFGDYQLAPAGTGHHVTSTDTGAVLYAHGDLDLQFVA